MAIASRQAPPWWDREVDYRGRRIRNDVRQAAQEIWERSYARALSVLGDVVDSDGLLESAVSQISRYLDRMNALPFTENAAGLLTVAFCRALGRQALRRRRYVNLNDLVDFAELRPASISNNLVDLRLDVERIVQHLSKRNSIIVALKSAGYEWKQIAYVVGTNTTAAKSSFWREVRRARSRVKKERFDSRLRRP